MSPLTPSFTNASADLKALPEKLRAPYAFLLEKSLRSPETAAFATYLFSAALGNPDAWRRVLEISIAAHTLRNRLRTPEEHSITNCMVAAVNILADTKVRESEAPPKPEAPTPKPEIQKPAPVKQAVKKQKPAPTFSKKPGQLISEK